MLELNRWKVHSLKFLMYPWSNTSFIRQQQFVYLPFDPSVRIGPISRDSLYLPFDCFLTSKPMTRHDMFRDRIIVLIRPKLFQGHDHLIHLYCANHMSFAASSAAPVIDRQPVRHLRNVGCLSWTYKGSTRTVRRIFS